jgi:hypothetical membrane protein
MFNKIQTFHDRYPLVGPTFWVISLQYFVTQLAVASGWPRPYSWLHNAISDLGNTACGIYGDRYVCSPYYTWMNASFIVLGATMVAGSLLIYQEFRKSRASLAGFSFMGLAGIGTILVGLFPENTISALHSLGAILPFLIGNIGLIVLGLSLDISRSFRIYSVLSGVVALVALPLFYTHNYLGLGLGGMERLTAYPQTVWLILFGMYMSRSRFRIARRR